MKVLVIKCNPVGRDGITAIIFNLFRAIEKNDLTMDLLTIEPLDELHCEEIRSGGGIAYTLPRRMARVPYYFFRLIRLICSGEYNIVHAHGNSATLAIEMLAAKLAGCKVRIAHSHNTSCKAKMANRLLKPLFRCCYTHGLACSDAAGRWMFGNRPFVVTNNGIETKRFCFNREYRQEIREKFGVLDNHVLLGHVGLFINTKNQGFLIDIMDQLKGLGEKYKLLLLGQGELKCQVEKKVAVLGLDKQVFFAGVSDEVEKYYSAFDLFVLPSFYEGLPLVLVEAQTSGLQCLVSDTVTREVDKTGNVEFLSLAEGPEAWAKKIETMTSAFVNRESMAAEATRRVRGSGYDIHDEAMKLKEFYITACQSKG